MTSSVPRINVAISAHGYGHLTQAAAVLQALSQRLKKMELRIQCELEKDIIAQRLGFDDFEHEPVVMDIGLIQPDPLHVDITASYRAYAAFHDGFHERVEQHALSLKNWGADLVLSDISYLALAAAERAEIDGIGLASLSWDHIVRAYFDINDESVQQWYRQTCKAYASATLALLPEPALPNDCFKQVQPIPPVFIAGAKDKTIRKALGIKANDTRPLVFCSLGGITSTKIPIDAMLAQRDFHWLVNQGYAAQGDHMHGLESLAHWPYRNIIASVDAVISKPGYGMAVEVAAHGLPFIYTCRGHFPDEPVIAAWLKQRTRCMEISNEAWFAGEFSAPLMILLATAKRPSLNCNGAEVAATILQGYL